MNKWCHKRGLIYKNLWTDRELLDLATAMQKYGASETAKISEYIRTKSEGDVSYINFKLKFIRKMYLEERKKVRKEESAMLIDDAKNWPAIRKWAMIAKAQSAKRQSAKQPRIDYSMEAIYDLLQGFHEEVEQPTNPQLVDVKSIYKFFMDCVRGKNPAELMPKESGVVLMLLKKLKEMKSNLDLDEEQKFITCYKEATKFVPFNKKDENEDSEDSDEGDSTAVPIPNEVYTVFHRHRRIINSFNPLLVPLWLLDKEQCYLHQVLQSTSDK